MRDSTQNSAEETTQPGDELPTSSRWRHIPEPQPLIVEQSQPALTPRRMSAVAAVILCVVCGTFAFLKVGPPRSDTPGEKRKVSPPPTTSSSTGIATNAPPVPSPAHSPTPERDQPRSVPSITDDDRKIDQVIRLYTANPDQDHTVTAQVLINLLPTLGKRGQAESARHIANLLPDAEYARVMHIWRNPRSERDVIEVFGNDLINRDPTIMLPAMIEALRQPSHPFHERGRQTLQLFLDADYGNDFAKWDEALAKFASIQTVARGSSGG